MSDVGKYLYLDALIADTRELQKAYVPTPDPWANEADVAAIFTGNDEIRRLTSPPTVSPEVERLAAVADDVAHN